MNLIILLPFLFLHVGMWSVVRALLDKTLHLVATAWSSVLRDSMYIHFDSRTGAQCGVAHTAWNGTCVHLLTFIPRWNAPHHTSSHCATWIESSSISAVWRNVAGALGPIKFHITPWLHHCSTWVDFVHSVMLRGEAERHNCIRGILWTLMQNGNAAKNQPHLTCCAVLRYVVQLCNVLWTCLYSHGWCGTSPTASIVSDTEKTPCFCYHECEP